MRRWDDVESEGKGKRKARPFATRGGLEIKKAALSLVPVEVRWSCTSWAAVGGRRYRGTSTPTHPRWDRLS